VKSSFQTKEWKAVKRGVHNDVGCAHFTGMKMRRIDDEVGLDLDQTPFVKTISSGGALGN